ncbi:MAG: glycerophosphodiester phosphodiesterase family protein, partial [Rikenellaceae bacterium]
GFWNSMNAAQNSIKAMKNAQQRNFYGTEFDVWITKDDVVVLFHDAAIKGIKIEDATFAELSALQIDNGEVIPTLDNFFTHGGISQTKYILEIKSHSTPEAESRVVKEVLDIVKRHKLENNIDYISFSKFICQSLVKDNAQHRVSYLNGELSPKEAKELGFWGIDYNYKIFEKNPTWIQDAKQIGLTVNVWTVNEPIKMQKMIDAGVDFITTDDPLMLNGIIYKTK